VYAVAFGGGDAVYATNEFAKLTSSAGQYFLANSASRYSYLVDANGDPYPNMPASNTTRTYYLETADDTRYTVSIASTNGTTSLTLKVSPQN
jgi:hypothetical protein